MAHEPPVSEDSDTHKAQTPVRVGDILLTTFTVLHEKAFAYMGLLVHPETGDVREELGQAKLAIEAMNSLLPLIKPFLTDSQNMEVTLAVTNAQLNYARKAGRSEQDESEPSPSPSERGVT
jgi:hypothetical protein